MTGRLFALGSVALLIVVVTRALTAAIVDFARCDVAERLEDNLPRS